MPMLLGSVRDDSHPGQAAREPPSSSSGRTTRPRSRCCATRAESSRLHRSRRGIPSVADVARAGHGIACRRLSLNDLLDLDTGELDLGTRRDVVLAVFDRARRSVAEGLVHPHLEPSDGRWHALWGATLDEVVTDELDRIAAAAPAMCAEPFDGDPDGFVHDLYACAVDELARRAIRAAGVRPSPACESRARPSASSVGLLSDEPTLPAHGGYAALERRLSAWVDGGLAHRSRAPWNVGLRLSEGEGGSVARGALAGGRRRPDPRAPGQPPPRRRRRGLCVPPRGRSTRRRRAQARVDRPVLERAGLPGSMPTSPKPCSTTTRCARSCARRCRGSRSSAYPSCCRANGFRARAACA